MRIRGLPAARHPDETRLGSNDRGAGLGRRGLRDEAPHAGAEGLRTAVRYAVSRAPADARPSSSPNGIWGPAACALGPLGALSLAADGAASASRSVEAFAPSLPALAVCREARRWHVGRAAFWAGG